MHQAQINAWAEPPKYTEVPDLRSPGPDEVRVKVLATGIHRVVRSRASGSHYSAGKLPHIPGIDGIGTTEDGKQVYFTSFTIGTIAEYVNMPKSAVFPVPEGIDPVQVAAAINPAMSSWMAFKHRTVNLPKDFTVLILGATSASGRIAIPLARSLGAGKVIGAGRNTTTLATLGLDETITIENEVEKTDFSNLDDVDVVLDYVYGPLANHLLATLKTPKPVQYVHIGSLSAPSQEIPLNGAVLRSKDITIRGSGPGAWSIPNFIKVLPELLQAVVKAPPQPTKTIALKDIEEGWIYKGSERLVVVP